MSKYIIAAVTVIVVMWGGIMTLAYFETEKAVDAWIQANSVGDPSAGDCYINEFHEGQYIWCFVPDARNPGGHTVTCYRVEDIDCEEVP
jgi:hypothetical protein